MSDWLQLAIAGVIIGLVFLSVHRHGRSNPQGTGTLSRQIGKLFAEVSTLKSKLANTATKAELGILSGEVRSLEQMAASSGEVIALEGKINQLRAELEGRAAAIAQKVEGLKDTGDHTREGVARIEAILMKGALDR